MKALVLIVTILAIVGGAGWYVLNSQKPSLPPGALEPSTFAECAKYYAVQNSSPRSCTNGAGVTLIENVGNAPLLRDSIQVSVPVPSDIISSPIYIRGDAMAEWYDTDGAIAVSILDTNGVSVGEGLLQTKNLVSYGRSYPFDGYITFKRPSYSATGVIVIKQNGSANSLKIPVIFR